MEPLDGHGSDICVRLICTEGQPEKSRPSVEADPFIDNVLSQKLLGDAEEFCW